MATRAIKDVTIKLGSTDLGGFLGMDGNNQNVNNLTVNTVLNMPFSISQVAGGEIFNFDLGLVDNVNISFDNLQKQFMIGNSATSTNELGVIHNSSSTTNYGGEVSQFDEIKLVNVGVSEFLTDSGQASINQQILSIGDMFCSRIVVNIGANYGIIKIDSAIFDGTNIRGEYRLSIF